MIVLAASKFALGVAIGLAAAEAPDPRAQPPEPVAAEQALAAVKSFRAAAPANAGGDAVVLALRELGKAQHPEIAKELKRLVKEGKGPARGEAIRLLGAQTKDKTAAEALKPFLRFNKRTDPALVAEAVRSLGYLGYGPKGFKQLDELFWESNDAQIRRAVVQAVGLQKDKAALSLLISLMDQPAPKDPNDPACPPASHWQAKHAEWIVYKDDVVASVEAILGKKVYNAAAAIEFVEGEGKKQRLTYKPGRNPWM